jgi:hypothetical protein
MTYKNLKKVYFFGFSLSRFWNFKERVIKIGRFDIFDMDYLIPPSSLLDNFAEVVGFVCEKLFNSLPKILQPLLARKFLKKIEPDSIVILCPFFMPIRRIVFNDHFFESLRSKNVKIIFYAHDILSEFDQLKWGIKMISRIEDGTFDISSTYNIEDAEKHPNFLYKPFPAPLKSVSLKILEELDSLKCIQLHKYQLSSFGYIFGRKRDPILSTMLTLSSSDINYAVHFTSKDPEDKSVTDFNNLPSLRNSTVPGGDFINRIINADCAMHISGSNYLTVTHGEAANFNRKIFTDAECVALEPWYNPNFVRIIDPFNVTQDDLEWLKNPIDVRYENTETLNFDNFIEFFIDQLPKNSNEGVR